MLILADWETVTMYNVIQFFNQYYVGIVSEIIAAIKVQFLKEKRKQNYNICYK